MQIDLQAIHTLIFVRMDGFKLEGVNGLKRDFENF